MGVVIMEEISGISTFADKERFQENSERYTVGRIG
jgi:hypothetical protein